MSTIFKKIISAATGLFFVVMTCALGLQNSDWERADDEGEQYTHLSSDGETSTSNQENLAHPVTVNTVTIETDELEHYYYGQDTAASFSPNGFGCRAPISLTSHTLEFDGNSQITHFSNDDDDDDDHDDDDDDHDDDDDDHDDDDDDHDDDDDDDDDNGQRNRAPVTVGTISNQTVNAGASINVSLGGYFSDPDSDSLTYTAESFYTSRATVSVLGATLTINGVDAGVARIEVTATDPGGLTANQQFTVTVNAQGNQAPTTAGTIPNQTVNVGASVNVSLGGYFSDPDSDSLTYTAESFYTSRATVSVLGATLTINGVDAGIARIEVTARIPAA